MTYIYPLSTEWERQEAQFLLHERWTERMNRFHEPTDDEIDRELARRELEWIREPWIKAAAEMELLANAARWNQ